MFTYEITFLPTSLPSLPSSYRRIRMVVGYPDGGVKNPMALSFVPKAALEAGKAISLLPASATSQGSWQQQVPQKATVTRPSSDVDLCFMTVRSCLSTLDMEAAASLWTQLTLSAHYISKTVSTSLYRS